MPAAPTTVVGGRYRLERAVGAGGMGVVWLGHDQVLGRPVALKRVGVLPGESADDRRRAMREARAAAALNHRHAVSVFDVVEHEDAPWLVMEYVEAQTLADLLAAGPLRAERAARIGAQVASALAAAHAAGIIHRDVKPANILVADDDEAKISDFGIAHLVVDERLTRTGLVSGTPAYFSPELASGAADPGPASDVWALGATLYAAVEGHPPHPRQANVLATLKSIAGDPVPPPVRAGLLTLPLTHLLDPDPDSRWTMAEAARALDELTHQGDASTVAAPPPTREAAARTPAPAPTPTSTPAPEATTASAPAPAPRPVPGATPAAPRRSRAYPLALGAAAALLALIAVLVALALRDPGAQDPTASDPERGAASSSSDESGSDESSPEESSSGKPKETEEPDPSADPTEDPSPEPSNPAPAPGGGPVRTVDGYYDLVPDDLDTAWAMLTPELQAEIGRGTYDGFWSTIADVDATDVRSTGPGAVTARITYTRNDGTTTAEDRAFTLVRAGEGYLIASDG
ncbi:serine/threonine-protein kinase [Nocardioides bigeumensis]|uniref:non-specific serine/threonine protein kinase n=1 Tax=Nocardioides bigeumensis TaxID=433657 RepID=A0ABP5KJB3_9ACTN